MKVKIIGAGSIGNHLAKACRNNDWEVHICDNDEEALKRTENMIYPDRYGKWDKEIKLYMMDEVPQGEYDIIMIGTPPDTHIPLASKAIDENPKLIHIEKPLCEPTMIGLKQMIDKLVDSTVDMVVGYNSTLIRPNKHLMRFFEGDIRYISCSWLEHWGGIFKAHPWLSGPKGSYLGYTAMGGGATCEHSHGINLIQHYLRLKNDRIRTLTGIVYREDDYDKECFAFFDTYTGIRGTINQNVIEKDFVKEISIYCNSSLRLGTTSEFDYVKIDNSRIKFDKKREDDFQPEVDHLGDIVRNPTLYDDSPIKVEYGIETMQVIKAILDSDGESVVVNYAI